MARFVTLFRGINVSGTQVRMDELKALHKNLGQSDIATYIRSGNVVFTDNETSASQLPAMIEEAFASRFGFQARAVLRTAAELETTIAHNPFVEKAASTPNWLIVLFLAEQPTGEALANLRQTYNGPEEFELVERELYIYYPNGIGRSKLTLPLIEKRLNTYGTGRNWNTVLQLQKMLQG
ncbi:DUF1697 domain-containing protein [Ktedonospora formicarum]|uniref:DUF1697 domain-containing protein n=1 Tax=Ktedonospora formicarum TaxID=2778364 RepID=A0A8J3MVQ3_9CHLR|nr:DUF1697 domain-containing protein [Ktedonospora formicarum]GHO46745.1 hypothetical protein KSX_49080 [Ktedonospora formicarum]